MRITGLSQTILFSASLAASLPEAISLLNSQVALKGEPATIRQKCSYQKPEFKTCMNARNQVRGNCPHYSELMVKDISNKERVGCLVHLIDIGTECLKMGCEHDEYRQDYGLILEDKKVCKQTCHFEQFWKRKLGVADHLPLWAQAPESFKDQGRAPLANFAKSCEDWYCAGKQFIKAEDRTKDVHQVKLQPEPEDWVEPKIDVKPETKQVERATSRDNAAPGPCKYAQPLLNNCLKRRLSENCWNCNDDHCLVKAAAAVKKCHAETCINDNFYAHMKHVPEEECARIFDAEVMDYVLPQLEIEAYHNHTWAQREMRHLKRDIFVSYCHQSIPLDWWGEPKTDPTEPAMYPGTRPEDEQGPRPQDEQETPPEDKPETPPEDKPETLPENEQEKPPEDEQETPPENEQEKPPEDEQETRPEDEQKPLGQRNDGEEEEPELPWPSDKPPVWIVPNMLNDDPLRKRSANISNTTTIFRPNNTTFKAHNTTFYPNGTFKFNNQANRTYKHVFTLSTTGTPTPTPTPFTAQPKPDLMESPRQDTCKREWSRCLDFETNGEGKRSYRCQTGYLTPHNSTAEHPKCQAHRAYGLLRCLYQGCQDPKFADLVKVSSPEKCGPLCEEKTRDFTEREGYKGTIFAACVERYCGGTKGPQHDMEPDEEGVRTGVASSMVAKQTDGVQRPRYPVVSARPNCKTHPKHCNS